MKNKSIEFQWDILKFESDVKLTRFDEGVILSLKYLDNKHSSKILEAGSGNGRVVKYLYDLGFKNVEGIELNNEIVDELNSREKGLNIYQGDILNFPYNNDSFDYIISFGVIEHFRFGVDEPLKVFYRILKNNGLAILTVPSFIIYRRIRYGLSFLKVSNLKKQKNIKGMNGFYYHVSPLYGEFFEYWMKPKEFRELCSSVGFKILEFKSISHQFGLLSIFGKLVGKEHNGYIQLNLIGKILNSILKVIPNFHNHMHAIVVMKI